MQIMGVGGAVAPAAISDALAGAQQAVSGVSDAPGAPRDSVDVGGAADSQHYRVRANMQQAASIQNMLKALASIQERTQDLLDYAAELSRAGLTSEGSAELFSLHLRLREQMRRFVAKLIASQEERRRQAGMVPGLALGFRSADLFNLEGGQVDLTTAAGVDSFLASVRRRTELFTSVQAFLELQMKRVIGETRCLEQGITAALNAEYKLTPTSAAENAGAAAEGLLKGTNVLLSVDRNRAKNRIAKLLEVVTPHA